MLKFKMICLYWLITLVYVIPAIGLAIVCFLPSDRIRNKAKELADLLVDTRYWICRDYIFAKKNGYLLTKI